MKRGLRSAFRALTILLFLVTAWTVFANVLSDDTELRARAGDLARKHAGCGDKCKVTYTKIDRGMLDERFTYDIDAKGQVVVVCRRAYVIFGDHACEPGKP
jgi:hypothetical protein